MRFATIRVLRHSALLAVALMGLAALAQSPSPSPEARITQALQFTGKKIEKLRPTPFAGFWEVTMGGGVLYVSADASHAFTGRVLDARTQANLTERRADPFPSYPRPVATRGTTEERIRQTLMVRMKDTIDAPPIAPTPVPGLWEAVIRTSDILYVDEAVDYLFVGELVALPSLDNLTQARQRQLSAIDFATLPLKDALLVRRGSGARTVAVFADPTDIYAQRLEAEMDTLGDLTVYVFVHPILGPGAVDQSRDIVCSPSPAEAWKVWMRKKQSPRAAPSSCDASVIDRNLIFGERNRIKVSPVLVFQDSSRHEGVLPAADLEKLLAAVKR